MDRFDAGRVQRRRGDRTDGERRHVGAQRGDDAGPHPAIGGSGEQRLRRRGTGERHRVQGAGSDGVQQPHHALRLNGCRPSVRCDGDHSRRRAEPIELFFIDEAVQLNGDCASGGALLDHLVHQRCRRLLLAHPGIGEPSGADRAARLRPAYQDPRIRQHGQQRRAQAGGVRRLQPSAHSVGSGRQHDVGSGLDDRPGVRDHPEVLCGRHNSQRRRVQHVGTSPLQCGDEVIRPAIRGDTDAESDELVRIEPGDGLGPVPLGGRRPVVGGDRGAGPDRPRRQRLAPWPCCSSPTAEPVTGDARVSSTAEPSSGTGISLGANQTAVTLGRWASSVRTARHPCRG